MRCTVAASTPIANNNVAQECQRSCSRMLRTFARRHSASKARLTFLGSRGVPFLVVNTRPSLLAPRDLCIAELVTPMSPQDRNEFRRQRHRGGRRFGFHVPQG